MKLSFQKKGKAMPSLSRASILEAVLFASGIPLSLPKLAEIIEAPEWEVQES